MSEIPPKPHLEISIPDGVFTLTPDNAHVRIYPLDYAFLNHVMFVKDDLAYYIFDHQELFDRMFEAGFDWTDEYDERVNDAWVAVKMSDFDTEIEELLA